MSQLTFGSLFAGIGGFDLGFERAGMKCRWQVEIDPFCQKVLAKHWPDVGRWDDVRTFPPAPAEDWEVDVICGGFPCQPVSLIGAGKAQGDARWLWPEFARIIRIVRPKIVVLENVPGLFIRGFDDVIGDLASLGFDAEWESLPASAFGAPHPRFRAFLVAHTHGTDWQEMRRSAPGQGRHTIIQACRDGGLTKDEHFGCEPGMGRVVYGVPSRVDRLAGLGNAVVPQIAEWIGRRIIEASQQ